MRNVDFHFVINDLIRATTSRARCSVSTDKAHSGRKTDTMACRDHHRHRRLPLGRYFSPRTVPFLSSAYSPGVAVRSIIYTSLFHSLLRPDPPGRRTLFDWFSFVASHTIERRTRKRIEIFCVQRQSQLRKIRLRLVLPTIAPKLANES